MVRESYRDKDFYQLMPTAKSAEGPLNLIKKRRVLIGRAKNCDVVLDYPDISAIHAVIEVKDNGFTVFDLKSRNGTFVNGQKSVASSLGVNDRISFASREYKISTFRGLSDKKRFSAILPASIEESFPEKPRLLNDPRISYPLSKDPRSEFSEYIFEDSDQIFPIFHYEPNARSIEVSVCSDDHVISVDYLPLKSGQYNLTGLSDCTHAVSFPFIKQNKRIPLVRVRGEDVFIRSLKGYSVTNLQGDDIAFARRGEQLLLDDDFMMYRRGEIGIYLRQSESPPTVDPAPVLRNDDDFKKYLFLMLFLALSFLFVLGFFKVDKEIIKDKAPERIATILYKKPKPIERPKPPIQKPIVVEKPKPKPRPKPKPKVAKDKNETNISNVTVKSKDSKTRTKPNKIDKKKKIVKKAATTIKARNPKKRPKLARPNKDKKKRIKPNVSPKRMTKKKKKPIVPKLDTQNKRVNKAITQAPKKSRSRIKRKRSKGRIDTFKAPKFKSTINNLLAKGSRFKGVKTRQSDVTVLDNTSISTNKAGATTKFATQTSNQGSIAGDIKGDIDGGSTLDRISDGKTIYTSGIPTKTVTLAGMDPEVIRRILLANLDKFRFCYQTILDRSSRSFDGIVRLNFIIGASGHVTKAGVGSGAVIPGRVKGCIVNVLKGIRFPEPMGGGIVEVNQPMNLISRSK